MRENHLIQPVQVSLYNGVKIFLEFLLAFPQAKLDSVKNSVRTSASKHV